MAMSQQDVRALLKERGKIVEDALASCAGVKGAPERLMESMGYSLLAGGKRLRPVLCLTAASLFNTPFEKVLPFACAIEMVHTYSLVHDDLPAMDNDDLRRGKPSNHRAFDEATAILAGDALQADAFRLMATSGVEAGALVEAMRVFAEAAGSAGMVGGQVLDMQATGRRIELSALEHLHALKTGAILHASIVCGGILAGAAEECVEALSGYGASLGVAFQIADDILDVVSDTETLGKPAHSDEEQDKNTYPVLVGLEKSRELAREHAARANAALSALDGRKDLNAPELDFLKGLALYTVERVN